MNRFVSVIVGVIATLFGLMAAPGLTPTSSAAPAHGYDYDARHYTTVCPDTMTERGPTWSCDRGSTYDAVDGRSNGATVRPSEPITRTIYGYDDTALLVRADSALGKTTQLALGRKGVVSSFQRWQVAAKTGYGPQTLSAAQLPRYEAAPYHGLTRTGRKNPAPTNGQETLTYSLQLKSTPTRRVGVDPDAGEYVVFDQTSAGIFHGHVRSWSELDNLMRRTLISAGMVDRRGNIL